MNNKFKFKKTSRKLLMKYLSPVMLKSVVDHTMITALSGHGKDMFGEGLITQKVGKYKVIDFYSEAREEGFLYPIPQDNPEFLKLLRERSAGKLKPEKFKSDVFMILGKNINYRKTLPKNVKVITFDEQDFKGDDVKEFLSGSSQAAKDLLGVMFFILSNVHGVEKPCLKDIEEELKRIFADLSLGKEKVYVPTYYQQIHPAVLVGIVTRVINIRESGIFDKAKEDGIEPIKIHDILKDKDTITTFSLQLLEGESQKALALGLLIKKIVDTKKNDPNLPRQLVYIREIQKFYQKRDDGVDKMYSMVRSNVEYILTEGRDAGLTLYANTQDFVTQIPQHIRTHFQKLFIGKQPKTSIVQLSNVVTIEPGIIDKFPRLEVGTYMAVGNGDYFYPLFVPPTRHKKKEKGFDVTGYLINQFGSHTWETKNLFKETFKIYEHKESNSMFTKPNQEINEPMVMDKPF